jgi:dipeptidyl aminopeptidase/acylaminoacyl peptidase
LTSLAPSPWITNCLEILPALPDNAELTGQVILEGGFVVGKGITGAPSKLDVATMILMPIQTPENTIQGGYQVSPNHRQVASWKSYFDANGKKTSVSVVIENNAGIKLTEVPGDIETWDTFYWLDNERIVIGAYGQPNVLNPFTGEFYGLSKWYAQSPGGLHIIPLWDVNGVFDSQLSRIFYIQEGLTMLLWDMQSQKILAQLEPYSKYISGDQPQWSWDDKEIVFGYVSATNMGEELFSISRDGEMSQLTALGQYYSQVRISKFSWSPDGRNIAFFFKDKSKDGSQYQLAVLNKETLQVTNYCNLGGFMDPKKENVRPIWSPDGTKLLIGRLEADQTTFKTILVDLSDEYAVQLAENLVPVGWMKSP